VNRAFPFDALHGLCHCVPHEGGFLIPELSNFDCLPGRAGGTPNRLEPVGLGTTLTALLIWPLLRVRRLYGRPLLMMDKTWPQLIRWANEHMLGSQLPVGGRPQPRPLVRCGTPWRGAGNHS